MQLQLWNPRLMMVSIQLAGVNHHCCCHVFQLFTSASHSSFELMHRFSPSNQMLYGHAPSVPLKTPTAPLNARCAGPPPRLAWHPMQSPLHRCPQQHPRHPYPVLVLVEPVASPGDVIFVRSSTRRVACDASSVKLLDRWSQHLLRHHRYLPLLVSQLQLVVESTLWIFPLQVE